MYDVSGIMSNGEMYVGNSILNRYQEATALRPHLNLLEKLWWMWYAYCGSDIVGTGVLLLLVIGISHVSKWLVQQVTKRVQSIGTQQKSPYPSTKPTKRDIDDRNLMIHIPLLVDFAVEFPLIVAFHPMTQILGSSSDVPFPRGPELLTQMAVFFVVEWASRPWVDRMLSDVVLTSNKGGPGTNAPQDSALMLSSAFISPRLTLMIGITLVDALSLLVTFTGRLHLITVVLWASLRRI